MSKKKPSPKCRLCLIRQQLDGKRVYRHCLFCNRIKSIRASLTKEERIFAMRDYIGFKRGERRAITP